MSSSSQNRQPSATQGGQGTTSTPANKSTGGILDKLASGGTSGGTGLSSSPPAKRSFDDGSHRRRSSEGTSAGMFTNLSNLKRGSQSEHPHKDQHVQPGFLGQMWNNFTQGSK